MGRFFITGSSDGIGSLAAKRLVSQGHRVVLHARNTKRAQDAEAACAGSLAVLVADLNNLEEMKRLASRADELGPYDAVVHNAGVMTPADGSSIFAVNTLAPYVLAARMSKPGRLVFVSSNMHRSGRPRLDGTGHAGLKRSGYSDTKLHDVMLTKAFARRWKDVECNALDPGWVPTKMGGRSAPGDLEEAVDTVTMLALGKGAAEGKTGRYFAHCQEERSADIADDVTLQDRLLDALAEISGVSIPS
ncbi:hypothetical protein VTK73DRAFT_9145 [Phialemonium thermophilum]|uniref:Short-chain dehydrogenase n=1 Tax=Phialemonium thermophilum TaxID=223376 RepID=A0ABR3XLI9_9PEZI